MSERILTVGGNKASRPISEFMTEKSKTWYVGPNAAGAGDDGRSGRSKETSLATLDEAIDRAVASTTSYNDIIYCLPNHSETVSSAGMIALDKIGLRVIGLGTGAYRPTFTFSTVDSTITMTAASCSIENIILVPSIDEVVSGIVVSAADCKVDVEVQDTTDIEFVTAILTTADADRLDINLKYIGYASGDACVAPIQLVGVDTARIYVDFFGVASTAVVNFITTACHNIDITGLFYNIGTTITKSVIDTEGNGTWSVRGWDGNSNANFTGGDNKTLAAADIETIASDLVVTNAIVDTIASHLLVVKSDVGAGASGLISDLETVKSDLVVADGIIDTIASHLLVVKSDVGAGASGALSSLETIASDLVVADGIIDTIASHLLVVKSDVGAGASGALSSLETIASDLVVADGIIDTIASHLLVVKSDVGAGASGALSSLETIASDLVVADGIIDTIASHLLVIKSDVGNGASGALSSLETIASDLILVDTVVDGVAAWQERTATSASVPLDGGTVSDLFAVSGPVILTGLFIVVTEAVSTNACKVAFRLDPTVGSTDLDITLCGASVANGLDITSAAIGDIIYAEMDATVAVKAAVGTALPTMTNASRMMLPAGGIDLDAANADPTSGIGTAYCTYIPLTATSTVT